MYDARPGASVFKHAPVGLGSNSKLARDLISPRGKLHYYRDATYFFNAAVSWDPVKAELCFGRCDIVDLSVSCTGISTFKTATFGIMIQCYMQNVSKNVSFRIQGLIRNIAQH